MMHPIRSENNTDTFTTVETPVQIEHFLKHRGVFLETL